MGWIPISSEDLRLIVFSVLYILVLAGMFIVTALNQEGRDGEQK